MSPTRSYGRHRVRWSKSEEEFQIQCDACLGWFPASREFWKVGRGCGRCQVCFDQHERVRVGPAGNPNYLSKREYQRQWYRDNRDLINARARAAYAARVQQEIEEIARTNVDKARSKSDQPPRFVENNGAHDGQRPRQWEVLSQPNIGAVPMTLRQPGRAVSTDSVR